MKNKHFFFIGCAWIVLRIAACESGEIVAPATKAAAWFSEQGAGWWGGLLGGGLGVLGGLFGTLGGLLIPKGKGRRLVMGMIAVFFALGGILTLTGLYALVTGQPWHVWYAFLLPGGLLTIMTPFFRKMIQHRYVQVELQKMQAQDA